MNVQYSGMRTRRQRILGAVFRRSGVTAIWPLCALLAVGGLLAACGSTTSSSSSPTSVASAKEQQSWHLVRPGYLTLATSGDYPPDSYINSNGVLTGYSIGLGRAIAAKLGLKLATPTVPYAEELAGLESGKFDMGDSAIYPDAANRAKFLFTIPDNSSGFVATILAKDKSVDPHGLNSLKGLNIGAVTGSSREEWALANKATLGYASYTGYTGVSQGVLALEDNQIQVFVNGPNVANYLIKQNPGKFLTVGPVIQAHALAIAIRKSDTALQAAVNKVLTTFRKDGTMAKLQMQYLGSVRPTPLSDTQLPPYTYPPTS